MDFRKFIKTLLIVSGAAFLPWFMTTAECQLTPAKEQPAVSIFVKKLGDQEYLSPNLISLHSLVCAYLPKSLKLINVLEAFREISNSVRYEFVIKAVDPNDVEICCHIVVIEKPWLRTYLGERARFLDYTNCSSYYVDEKYENEAKYEPIKPKKEAGAAPYNNLSGIESQILPKGVHKTERLDKTYNFKEPDYTEKRLSGDAKEFLESFFETNSKSEVPAVEVFESSRNREIYDEIIKNTSHSRESLYEGYNYFVTRIKRNTNSQQFLYPQRTQTSNTDESEYRNNEIRHVLNKKEALKWQKEKDILNYEDVINYSQKFCSDKLNELTDLELSVINSSLRESTIKSCGNLLNKAEYLFIKYQRKYNKSYTDIENSERFQIFKRNLAKINLLKKMEQGTAIYGITEFADMTEAEYKQKTGLLLRTSENEIKNKLDDIPTFKLPKEHDWRKMGIISKVKNQGNCGSCWAFSVTGNIEGLHAIKTGKLEEYSEQELLDCDTVDSACNGGLPDNAYKAIEKLGGLELENEYPYVAKKDKCNFNNSLVHVKVKGAIDLPMNETAMALWLVANGPISIGINANAMQFYRGGISHPWKFLCRPKGIDHGVLIVGFGVEEYPLFNKTLPFWIVKNSWGMKWGEQGYYRIYRGDNSCGINSMASSAVLA